MGVRVDGSTYKGHHYTNQVQNVLQAMLAYNGVVREFCAQSEAAQPKELDVGIISFITLSREGSLASFRRGVEGTGRCGLGGSLEKLESTEWPWERDSGA